MIAYSVSKVFVTFILITFSDCMHMISIIISPSMIIGKAK